MKKCQLALPPSPPPPSPTPTSKHNPPSLPTKSVESSMPNSNRAKSSRVCPPIYSGKSRINYIPYEKKVIEYEERQYVEKVPVKRKVIEYQERKVIEEVPREVIATDYYAV